MKELRELKKKTKILNLNLPVDKTTTTPNNAILECPQLAPESEKNTWL